MNKEKKKKLITTICATVIAVALFVICFSLLFKTKYSNVQIVLMDGDTKVSTITKRKGSTVGELPTLTKEGYEFLGWYYDNSLDLKIQSYDVFNTNHVIVAGFSKIVTKNASGFSEDLSLLNSKFITVDAKNYNILSDDLKQLSDNKFTQIEIKNHANSLTINNEFSLNNNLKVLKVGNVLNIAENAFKNCYSLNTLNFKSVNNIEQNAFYNCVSLKNIDLSTAVSIGKNAFYGCTLLSSVSLGQRLISVDASAFAFSNVTEFKLDLNKSYFQVENNVLYSSNFETLIYVLPEFSGKLNINANTKRIGDYAGYKNNKITEIYTTSAVNVGKFSFYSASKLYSVTLNGLTSFSVEQSAFENCESLNKVTLGYGLNLLKESAFKNNYKLESVNFLNSSMQSIENAVFYNCKSLKTIKLPSTVTSFGHEVFSGCNSLSSVTLPTNLDALPFRTFYNNNSLTQVTSSNIDRIEDEVFYNCTSLSMLTSNLLTASYIGNSAFDSCTSLQSVKLDNLIVVSSKAFYNCTSLNNASFANIKQIKDRAFSFSSITNFIIVNSIENIDNMAFENCASLEYFASTTNANYVIDDGVLYNADKSDILCYPEAKKTNFFTIKNSVNNISSSGLFKNKNIASFSVESANTSYSASGGILYNKEGTKIIKYPTAIYEYNLVVKEGVKSIGKDAFYNCYIISLTLPTSLVELENGCLEGILNLNKLTTPFVGQNSTQNKFLGYIFGSNNAMAANEYLPASLKEVTVLKDSFIDEYAFYELTNIEKVVYKNSVVSIGEYSFYEAQSLKSITIEGILEKICSYSFFNTSSLNTIEFGYTANLIVESDVFMNVNNTVTVNINNDNQTVSHDARNKIKSKFTAIYSRSERWIWKFM